MADTDPPAAASATVSRVARVPAPLGREAVRAIVAWSFFDWANSAFPTLINTFVFPTYFTTAVAPDAATGTAQWGWAMAAAGMLIALMSPPLGAIADRGGRRKPWLGACTVATVIGAALLWEVRPDASWTRWALVNAVAATVGFELGTVFYNAMLPDLVPRRLIGRVSGWAWGVGYAGGLACLLLALWVLIEPAVPPFGLDRAAAEPVRATSLLVACWFALFALPLFLLVPESGRLREPIGEAVRNGLGAMLKLLPELRRQPDVARFLVSRLFYTDGINTLFAFGAIYAAGTFGMTTDEILLFGIATNITAGLGAAAFAWIDDLIGPKRTVLVALAATIGLCAALLGVREKVWFWALALPLGIFLGPAQAASRSLMAHMAPPAMRNEYFGLFALSGRATAFIGPATLGWVTHATGSQRAGMATIVPFLVLGALILATVRAPARDAAQPEAEAGASGTAG